MTCDTKTPKFIFAVYQKYEILRKKTFIKKRLTYSVFLFIHKPPIHSW